MSTSPRRTVSALKQSFEQSNHDSSKQASLAQHHKQTPPRPGCLANMSTQKKLAKLQHATQPSIDTILDSHAGAVPSQLRPSASRHPSRIGPNPLERPNTPGATAMEHPVTIEFYWPGTQPPVYIATDLSNPQWKPVEMDSTQDEHGEYRFSIVFEAEEGEYQYKLRLGHGDWWLCDDSVPKVKDEAGNENNSVVVKIEAKAGGVDSNSGSASDEQVSRQDSHRADSAHLTPLLQHEKPPSGKAVETNQQDHPTHFRHIPQNSEAHSPLFRHETLVLSTSDDNHDPGHDSGDEPESFPLLRHESISPSSHEQEHSPLFRHESISIDNKQHQHDGVRSSSSPRHGGRKYSSGSIPEEADPNDPTLERFPTDHKGIIEHLDRTRRSMQEDQTSDGHERLRRPSHPASVVASTSSSLPSVTEDDDEETRDDNKTINDDPESPGPDAEVPMVMISEPQDRPFAPITPPMTPKDDQELDGQSQLDGDQGDTPMGVREKVHHFRKKVHHKAKKAADNGLPVFAVGIAIALAAASAFLSIWYFKT